MAEAFFDLLAVRNNCQQGITKMNSSLHRTKHEHLGVNGQKTYPGDVTDSELDSMRLSSKMCLENNCIVLKDMLQESDVEDEQLNMLKLNSTFMIKSENARLYTPSILTRLPIEETPSAFCPNAAKHSDLVTNLPLPVACPTCWSVQRLGCAAKKKPKPIKRSSPNQQPKRVQSCKMKITGPSMDNSTASMGKIGPVASRSNGELKHNNTTAERKDRSAQYVQTRTKAKCNKSVTGKTSMPNEGAKTKTGNTRKTSVPKPDKQVEIKTRTRTIIPVKFTSL